MSKPGGEFSPPLCSDPKESKMVMNKAALYKISYGIYIVASKKGKRLNGQIANTVFQVTSEPMQVVISINKQNLTHEFISESGVFSVSVLSVDTPMAQIGKFGFKSGRDIDKFEGTNYRIGSTGAPIVLDNAVAYIECKVVDSIDVGTHTLFIGEVVDGDVLSDKEPMTYAYYHMVKKGKSPKTAPTYISEEPVGAAEKEGKKMAKYRCTICGYIYDPEVGDPDSGIEPGTPFEEIPDDWTCPICGATKDDFEKIED